MKKSKLSLGLVTSFVASLALAGCGSVSSKDNSILTYTGYDGVTKYEIVTDSMYDEYRKDSNVISTFYDRVLEVLIRDRFMDTDHPFANTSKDYETIKALAEEDVKAAKAKASENAKNNGTSYDTEWESILNGENVEDEEELLQKYIYNQEKAVLEDALYATLTQGDQGNKLKEDWINGALPYHIRHILAKVDSGASDYTRGTITSDQAKRLSDVGLALGLANDTFGGIAVRLSEDEGSAKLYGDVGLVTNKATTSGTFSMVTEFQLAIYIYDAIYRNRSNDATTAEGKITNKLIPDGAAAKFAKIAKVPYEVFQLLASEENGGYGDVTTRDKKIVGEGEEAVYPRNILWNKYLNHHEPFVITDDTVADYYNGATVKAIDDTHGKDEVVAMLGEITDATPATAKTNYAKLDIDGVGAAGAVNEYDAANKVTGFRKASDAGVPGLGETKILVDEQGRPIFGVRSEYGIHFIVVEKSSFDEGLMTYYQEYTPKQADWNVPDGTPTYVNYAGFDDSTMTSRASAVKDAIKGFDGTYQYRLFETLLTDAKANNRFKLDDSAEGQRANDLLNEITSYVNLQKTTDEHQGKTDYDQETGYELAWDNFMDKIDQQNEERVKYERVVPWGCAIGFNKNINYNDVKALYEIGGACYYGNKTK